MILAGVGFILIYPTAQRDLLAAAVVASFPLFAGTLGQRQDLALLLLIMGLGLTLRARGLAVAGGFVLALLAIKIHLFLLVPVALLMRREWRMLLGLVSSGVILAVVSFWAAGLGWVQEYLALISGPGVISDPAGKPNLHGVLAGVPHAGWWELGLGLAVLVGVGVAGRRNSFELAFAGGLLGSFLVSNHAYVHDCAVLIPGLVEMVTRMNGKRRWSTITGANDLASTAPYGRGSGSRVADVGRVLGWGVAVLLLTPFPYFLPPLLIHIREGVVPALLIAAALVALTPGESKA
jgi:hypothetical protein